MPARDYREQPLKGPIMKSLKRTSGLAALAMTATLALTACGGDAEESAEDTTSQAGDATDEATEEAPEEESADADPAAQTYGPGCELVPTDGAGSFGGMATEPVATAASANPLLGTLVDAVTAAGLGDTLNSQEAITVFAPTDDAFAEIPKKDLNALLGKPEQLGGILTHHVVEGRVAPEDLSGEFDTLAGDTLTINGEGEAATIGAEEAAVLCGNIPTANATVYVIDSVLMPTG